MSEAEAAALEAISRKLNVLIALALRQLVGDTTFEKPGRGRRGVGEIARLLADMGLEARDIAQIVGAPLTSVRTLIAPHRRR